MSHYAPVIKGWQLTFSDDEQYMYVSRDGAPGEIHIKAEDEGYVVDIWSDDDPPDVIAGTSAFYTELERE
jgi:hypothetical protein